jgi:hypothetical protein
MEKLGKRYVYIREDPNVDSNAAVGWIKNDIWSEYKNINAYLRYFSSTSG